MKTIRPWLWTPGFVIGCAVLLGMFIAAAVIQPGQAVVVLVGGPLLIGVIGWARLRPIRLEITTTVVRANQGWYQPKKQAPRSEIRAIHYFPRLISFRGPDDEPIMMIAPNWTLRQMLEVASELKVPLYDHTRWLGMRRVEIGRLAYDPASGPMARPVNR